MINPEEADKLPPETSPEDSALIADAGSLRDLARMPREERRQAIQAAGVSVDADEVEAWDGAVGDVTTPEDDVDVRATRSAFPEVVRGVREILGARLCAYLGSVKETRAVHQWADGSRKPNTEVQRRLRIALQAAAPIAAADSPAVAQAWFQGLNPQLDDRSPLRLLREGDLDEVGPDVIGATRAFLASG